MLTAHAFSKVCRAASSGGTASGSPPAFLTVPVTCARTSVRRYHLNGADDAVRYLADSRVGEWAHHPTSQSMATGNQAVIDGLDWYIAEDIASNRPLLALDDTTTIAIGRGALRVRLDAVFRHTAAVSGRAVLWDGPDFRDDEAPLIAYPFAAALAALYPNKPHRSIDVWQARRRHAVEVPVTEAVQCQREAARLYDANWDS